MSIFSNVQSSIVALEADNKKFNLLIKSFKSTIEENYKLDILKEEMLNLLCQILSNHSEDVLSVSYSMRVNEIQSKLIDILNEKEKKIELSLSSRETMVNSLREVIGAIYSIELLKNNIHIATNIEKRLLDIKNNTSDIENIDKKVCAIKFLQDKLKIYKREIKKLIKILKDHKYKTEISFEEKKEIYDIYCKISLEDQENDNHSKMFNEDIYNQNKENLVTDYILYFENIFIKNAEAVGIKLDSYIENIEEIFFKKDSKSTLINNLLEYIIQRYTLQIDCYGKELIQKYKKSISQLKFQLSSCYKFDILTDIEKIYLDTISSESLPTYILNSKYYTNIESLLFNVKKEEINIETIKLNDFISDLNDKLYEKFDPKKYLQMYEFNYKYKSRVIAFFRQYYLDLLEESKNEIIDEYVEKLEKYLSENLSKTGDILTLNSDIVLMDNQIECIKNSIDNINKNYDEFKDENLRSYMKAIEKRYSVKNLYDSVMKSKSKFIYKLKSKKTIREENIEISKFLDDKKINMELKKSIIEELFQNNEILKEEVLEKVM